MADNIHISTTTRIRSGFAPSSRSMRCAPMSSCAKLRAMRVLLPCLDFSLYLAAWFTSLQALHGIVVRGLEGYGESKDLWKTYDEHVVRRRSEEQTRLAKVAKAPNRHRCAADECGVQVINKRALRRCGGSCLSKKNHTITVWSVKQRFSVQRTIGLKDCSISPMFFAALARSSVLLHRWHDIRRINSRLGWRPRLGRHRDLRHVLSQAPGRCGGMVDSKRC
ncbi:hypothetical protein L226DRAFT_116067 [Lentinus tigrinus ALCF2SS1-7]|uniref:uncharacterized protein n=1 Tax=Lentinus tigrinus ALCF2SS1-7 TaxID=1328758 RepID=UPI001165D865|nr:hypothetical protein L226DRAFT_116067 [Lentinus tigrinus ALCF2SS1-7]